MTVSESQQKMLRKLPGVDHVFELAKALPFFESIPKTVIVKSIRETLENRRNRILSTDISSHEERLSDDRIIELVRKPLKRLRQ